MSIFDLPRLHFGGTAITRLPTGPRSGLLDLSSNTAVAGSAPFPANRPPQEYYEFLDRQGFRFEPDGTAAENGRFNSVKGWNFGANGHFWIDAAVVGCELRPGEIDTGDHVVGRQLDLWGHYNDYLSTTANRARVFDVDPASNRTTAVLVGQLALGRLGRSHDSGYMAIGDVHDVSPPRWQNSRHVLRPPGHPLDRELSRSVVHQFVVDKSDRLNWFDEAAESPAVAVLRDLVETDRCGGFLVQLGLFEMAPPTANDAPDRWQLRGTIAPWCPDDMRTYPAGRLLTARPPQREVPAAPLHNLSIEVGRDHVTVNMVTAVGLVSRSLIDPEQNEPIDVDDLQVRTKSGRLLATLPRSGCTQAALSRSGGVLATTRCDGEHDDPGEPLVVRGTDGAVLLTEEEVNVQSDRACVFLEHPKPGGDDYAVDLPVRSFVRGKPAKVPDIGVHQFFNPRALPLDERACLARARCTDVAIVEVAPSRVGDPESYRTSCTLETDDSGHGVLAVRGAEAGATELLLLPPGTPLPADPGAAGSAQVAYDNDDRLRYWSAAGALSVRVLPDTWHLDEIPDEEVTFERVYREVFAYYELMYSFMGNEIMSLADISKVSTHARMIWLMSDPRNKGKTYYMPSTRDMTDPQANLLLRFMHRIEGARQAPPRLAAERPEPGRIADREELCRVLRQAATVELAVMLQYLYALWSLPTYSAGLEYVRRGEWTPEQLELMCGGGPQSMHSGVRGSLLNVAREEMIHFLVINNIIMATGEPFHLPDIHFGALNNQLPVPLDFSLEAFGPGSLQRFIALEQPYDLVRDVAANTAPDRSGPYPYGSLSEMYAAIREAIQRIPDAILVEPGRGGGEHHLFMRESLNLTHPDYHLEVDDVSSAVFGIDFVTEQGEGGVLETTSSDDEESHYDTFLRISHLLDSAYTVGPGGRRVPWNPAYPVVRNPTLRAGNPSCELVADEQARAAMQLFNRSYEVTMRLMVQHFGASPDKSTRRSRLMNASLDLMTGVLRPVAELTVTLPAGLPGRTAGPSFELDRPCPVISRPDVAAKWFSRRFAELSADAAKIPGLTETVPQLLAHFAEYFARVDPREL